MNKIIPLFILTIIAVSCSGCSSQKQNNQSFNKQNTMTLLIKSMATGYVKSGNYGGSTQYEVFPSVYHYSYFNGDTSEKNEEFQSILGVYLQNITVNNIVTLEEYLTYLYNNNTEKLKEIHSNFQDNIEKGNSHQELPKLFFVEDEANTVLRVSPYLVSLNWNEHTTNLNLFLQTNAYHFSSEIPDEFYTKYYGK